MTENTFKICTLCGHVWAGRDAFTADPEVVLIGYQVHFEELKAGLFLFNHIVPECGTTMAVQCDAFLDLHTGPVFDTRFTGSKECPGHCLHRNELTPCPVACECAFVREVIQHIANRPAQSAAAI